MAGRLRVVTSQIVCCGAPTGVTVKHGREKILPKKIIIRAPKEIRSSPTKLLLPLPLGKFCQILL